MTDRAGAVRLESKVYKAQDATRVPFRANLASNHNPGRKAKNPGLTSLAGSTEPGRASAVLLSEDKTLLRQGAKNCETVQALRRNHARDTKKERNCYLRGSSPSRRDSSSNLGSRRASDCAGVCVDERQQDVLDWGALSILRWPKRLLGRRRTHSGARVRGRSRRKWGQ